MNDLEARLPLAVIVLAAGQSSRMGRAKQLEVVDGEPMVVRAGHLALGCGAERTVVVTGAYAEQVEQQLASLRQSEGLQLVHNPNWAQGQATSVHVAVQSLPDTIEAALFLPVDQPFVTSEFLHSVIESWLAGAEIVAPKVDGEPRGAPAIFARRYFAELLEIQGDVGGRVVLMKHKNEVRWIAADAKILRDIDTPADLVGSGQQRID